MIKIVKGLIIGNLFEKLRIFFVLLQRFLKLKDYIINTD